MKSFCILVILWALLAYGYPAPAPENYKFPYQSWAVWYSIQKHNCSANTVDVIELCQRCAIFTKSEIVYPDCCDDRDDVLGWCIKAEAFGRIPSPAS